MRDKFESKVLHYLSSLDSFWGKMIIIGVIFVAGCTAGSYYKETNMLREQFASEKEEWLRQCRYIDSLREHILSIQNENVKLNNQVNELKFKLNHNEKK
jgi:uncharacterized protein YlxW (UPF0749 family)